MKRHVAKRQGRGLQFRTFKGRSGKLYQVFLAMNGGYHVFAEVEAKEAAKDCGAPDGNTRAQWKALWDGRPPTPPKEVSTAAPVAAGKPSELRGFARARAKSQT